MAELWHPILEVSQTGPRGLAVIPVLLHCYFALGGSLVRTLSVTSLKGGQSD